MVVVYTPKMTMHPPLDFKSSKVVFYDVLLIMSFCDCSTEKNSNNKCKQFSRWQHGGKWQIKSGCLVVALSQPFKTMRSKGRFSRPGWYTCSIYALCFTSYLCVSRVNLHVVLSFRYSRLISSTYMLLCGFAASFISLHLQVMLCSFHIPCARISNANSHSLSF